MKILFKGVLFVKSKYIDRLQPHELKFLTCFIKWLNFVMKWYSLKWKCVERLYFIKSQPELILSTFDPKRTKTKGTSALSNLYFLVTLEKGDLKICGFSILSRLGSDWLINFKLCIKYFKIDPYCLNQIMAGSSSKRKKDSTLDGEVFVKQPSSDNEVIGLSRNSFKSPKK